MCGLARIYSLALTLGIMYSIFGIVYATVVATMYIPSFQFTDKVKYSWYHYQRWEIQYYRHEVILKEYGSGI